MTDTTQNPFFDPFSELKPGTIVGPDQPLPRIQIPYISTLVSKSQESKGTLIMVNVGEALNKAGITPREPILAVNEGIGIELNLNLFSSTTGMQTPIQMNPTEITGTQTVGRDIPKDAREVRNVLHLITGQRTGSRHDSFNINELKKIARNLNLSTNGNKDAIANRIRTHIEEFFNLPRQQ